MEPLAELPVVLSFTQINDYLTCPKRFGHRWIAQDCPKEQKSYEQSAGIKEHEAIRKRLKLREPLPAEYEKLGPICDAIDAKEGEKHVELTIGCTRSGAACDFFAPECALRTRVDLCIIQAPAAVVIDWKRSKPWEDPTELKIQSILLKAHFPQLTSIMAFYWWFRENRPGHLYNLSDTAAAWLSVQGISKAIRYRIDTNDWPPDENALCPWCPVTKEMCKFKRDPK